MKEGRLEDQPRYLGFAVPSGTLDWPTRSIGHRPRGTRLIAPSFSLVFKGPIVALSEFGYGRGGFH